jgi:DNA/RNA endonuclease YhcR with UshA esterase domain
MVEKSYFFLALSLAGIFLLLFLSKTLEPPLSPINQLSEKNLNQQVKVQASITSIITPRGYDFQILVLQDKTANITAILDSLTNLTSNKTKTYFITGKIQEYSNTHTNKSELQISINKIREING